MHNTYIDFMKAFVCIYISVKVVYDLQKLYYVAAFLVGRARRGNILFYALQYNLESKLTMRAFVTFFSTSCDKILHTKTHLNVIYILYQ